MDFKKEITRSRDGFTSVLESVKGSALIRGAYRGLFIQNATANAAWRRSRRNGLNKTNLNKTN